MAFSSNRTPSSTILLSVANIATGLRHTDRSPGVIVVTDAITGARLFRTAIAPTSMESCLTPISNLTLKDFEDAPEFEEAAAGLKARLEALQIQANSAQTQVHEEGSAPADNAPTVRDVDGIDGRSASVFEKGQVAASLLETPLTIVGQGIRQLTKLFGLTPGVHYNRLVDFDRIFSKFNEQFQCTSTFHLAHLASCANITIPPPGVGADAETAVMRELILRFAYKEDQLNALHAKALRTLPPPTKEEQLRGRYDGVCLGSTPSVCSCEIGKMAIDFTAEQQKKAIEILQACDIIPPVFTSAPAPVPSYERHPNIRPPPPYSGPPSTAVFNVAESLLPLEEVAVGSSIFSRSNQSKNGLSPNAPPFVVSSDQGELQPNPSQHFDPTFQPGFVPPQQYAPAPSKRPQHHTTYRQEQYSRYPPAPQQYQQAMWSTGPYRGADRGSFRSRGDPQRGRAGGLSVSSAPWHPRPASPFRQLRQASPPRQRPCTEDKDDENMSPLERTMQAVNQVAIAGVKSAKVGAAKETSEVLRSAGGPLPSSVASFTPSTTAPYYSTNMGPNSTRGGTSNHSNGNGWDPTRSTFQFSQPK